MFPARALVLCLVLSVVRFCDAADQILFTRLAPQEARLFVSNADGSAEQPLTPAGSLDYNPGWSPKGDWIVFTSERGGSADLYRVHPDGTGLERLTDDPAFDDQAAFSPDEKRIVFVSTRAAGRANLWILDVASRKAVPLTSGNGGDFRPSWSPDGKWIAFSSDRETSLPAAKGRWERLQVVDIYVVRPDGSGLRRITQHGDFCGSPKWTADSKSVVAYCMTSQETWDYRVGHIKDGDTKLVRIDVASGTVTPIAGNDGVKFLPTVLPSGEVGYLRRNEGDRGVFYSDGRKGPAGADVHTPSWSPDGSRIVYSRYTSKRTAEPVKLFSRSSKYELYGTAALPAYGPSGDRFAVTMIGAEGTKLVLVNDGKPGQTILERKDLILAPSWSPDERQLLFGTGAFTAFLDFDAGGKKPSDRVNGGAQVAMVNDDGSGFHLITSGPNNNAFPSYAPDGKHVVYRTAGPEGDGLRIMNLEDHSIAKLTDAYDNFPQWSPRGDVIAFVRQTGGNFEVFTIHPDGTGLKQLTDIHGNEAHLGWSPDGQRIVFTSSRMGFKDEALYQGNPQPYGEIFVMRKDGTDVEQLTDNQWEDGVPTWRPDKSKLASTGTYAK
jgi:Tol biopolymer transport system component